jgi:hypothetical protein
MLQVRRQQQRSPIPLKATIQDVPHALLVELFRYVPFEDR